MSDNKCKHEDYDEYFTKCFGCGLELIDIIKTADNERDARDGAIYWQELFSEQSMSYSELMQWQAVFTEIGAKFGLTDEFKENGIL